MENQNIDKYQLSKEELEKLNKALKIVIDTKNKKELRRFLLPANHPNHPNQQKNWAHLVHQVHLKYPI